MSDLLHVLVRLVVTVVSFSTALLLWGWAVRREERRARGPRRREACP
jgi:hypothetical protein